MISQQAKLAFRQYESDHVDKSARLDRKTLRDAYLQGYQQAQSDLAPQSMTRAKMLWYIGAVLFSLGLWGLIYLVGRAVVGLF
jgi:hypothetical protein